MGEQLVLGQVLGVDDEPLYLRLMRMNLEEAGYEFVGVDNGDEALSILKHQPTDIVLLDVRMPHRDGFTVLKELREFSDVPVILVTALDEETDKVRGLRLGADDYLTKPFGARELLARVEAVMRRCHRTPRPPVVVGDLCIDLDQRRVFRGGKEIHLSRTQFRLLRYLAEHRGKLVPQAQLVREVWGPLYEPDFVGLRICMYRLRQKLEANPDEPTLLVTVPNFGYMLQLPPAEGQTQGLPLPACVNNLHSS